MQDLLEQQLLLALEALHVPLVLLQGPAQGLYVALGALLERLLDRPQLVAIPGRKIA